MKNQLIFPMAFYVFYIWGLAIYMFRNRVRTIKAGQVSPKYFKAFAGEPPPERIVLIGRHYDNQFQVPLLFLIVCGLHMMVGAANDMTLIVAWLFVISRLFHSWVHLGSNKLQRRVVAFTLGWVAILVLWGQLVYFALGF